MDWEQGLGLFLCPMGLVLHTEIRVSGEGAPLGRREQVYGDVKGGGDGRALLSAGVKTEPAAGDGGAEPSSARPG